MALRASTILIANLILISSLLAVADTLIWSSASCECDMENDWIFDYGRNNTSITMMITIHPGTETWSSYNIHLPPVVVGYAAFDASTNAPLAVTLVEEQTKVTAFIDFGGPKGEGWAYYVKFVDTTGGINEQKLTDYWDWTSTYRLTHTFHLWLPKGYDVAGIIPARNFTKAILQQRVYVSFFGATASNEKYEWTLAAKRVSTLPNYSLTTVVINIATSATRTLTSSITVQTETTSSESLASSSTQTPAGMFVGQESMTLGVGLAVAAIALTSTVLILRRKKSAQVTAVPTLAPSRKQATPRLEQPLISQGGISTGYDDLDTLLGGGLPKGYSIVFISPSCDEIELITQRIIESCIASGVSTFYVSRDISKARELAVSHVRDFYAFCAQPGIKLQGPSNLYQIPGTDNLSELNISLGTTIMSIDKTNKSKLIIVDILSDVLLRHKALLTRRWLSDFVTKRKAEGFTVVAILDPFAGAKEETQTIIGLFDGVISISEKEISERSRRFLVIKKMHGRLYSENELMLEKEKLFQSRREPEQAVRKESPMYCAKCGAPLPVDSRFCLKCGATQS